VFGQRSGSDLKVAANPGLSWRVWDQTSLRSIGWTQLQGIGARNQKLRAKNKCMHACLCSRWPSGSGLGIQRHHPCGFGAMLDLQSLGALNPHPITLKLQLDKSANNNAWQIQIID
jgi:hypothetical protein